MKWFLLALVFYLSLWAQADDYQTNRSSNMIGAITTPYLPFARPGDTFGSLLINKRSSTPETFTIYDASAGAFNSLGIIDLSTGVGATANVGNEYTYNILLSSGLSFTKSAGSADITLIWRNKSGRP